MGIHTQHITHITETFHAWNTQGEKPQGVVLIEKLKTDGNKLWIAENEMGNFIIVNEAFLKTGLD